MYDTASLMSLGSPSHTPWVQAAHHCFSFLTSSVNTRGALTRRQQALHRHTSRIHISNSSRSVREMRRASSPRPRPYCLHYPRAQCMVRPAPRTFPPSNLTEEMWIACARTRMAIITTLMANTRSLRRRPAVRFHVIISASVARAMYRSGSKSCPSRSPPEFQRPPQKARRR
jgi:hypothetical protein